MKENSVVLLCCVFPPLWDGRSDIIIIDSYTVYTNLSTGRYSRNTGILIYSLYMVLIKKEKKIAWSFRIVYADLSRIFMTRETLHFNQTAVA